MQFRSFGENAFFLFAGQAFAATTTLILVPLLARYLGIADYGRYAYVYAFVGLFETLSVFGLHHIFVREVARKRDEAPAYLASTLRVKALLTLAVFALIHLASAALVTPDLRLVVTICVCEVLLRKFFMINISVGRAFERMQYEFVTTVLERTSALMAVLLVIRLDWGLTGVFLAFLLAAVVHSLVGTSLIWTRLARPRFGQGQGLSRSMLRESWPLGLSRQAEVVYSRTGTVLLGQWTVPRVVGTYSGGYRIYQIISQIVADSISQSAYPALSRLTHHPRRFARSLSRVARLDVLAGILLAATVWGTAPVAIRLLLGPEFESSISILRWMSIAIPFTFLNRLLGVALQSANRQHVDGFLTTATLFVNLILNWALISPLGATGAAWALVLAEFFSFGAKGFALAKRGLPEPEPQAHSRS